MKLSFNLTNAILKSIISMTSNTKEMEDVRKERENYNQPR